MTFDQIIGNLKNKIYHPIYFLVGEEPYFIDEISDYIENNVLEESEKDFNQSIIYGRDTNVPAVISSAKRYPMMASHQVVIVKEAQYLEDIENLQPYVEKPLDSTLLVINYKYKKLDGRTTFAKELKNKAVLFESKRIYDNQVPTWINNYLKQKGYRITPKASEMLTEFLGSDLGKIVNELSKLILNVPEKSEINENHVEQNIGISKDFNIFELQNAIGLRNIVKANQIAGYFAASPKENPLIKTVIMLFSYFTRLLIYHQLTDKSRNNVASALGVNPNFVKDYESAARNYHPEKIKRIISLLREYDLKAKGVDNVSTEDGELLRELLFKILH
ncbi:MAG: DNA polymerase III subunit delta [Bacteroidetes bacterium]|nr:DNA polymerase III subunit delta [Bacteroidota bacterium]